MSESKVVPLSSISAPEAPLRHAMESTGIEELTLSIRTMGLLQPLVAKVSPHGYEVIAGHRRLVACRLAPLDRVPIIVVEGDAEYYAAAMLAENIQRRDLTPIEEATALRTMRDVLGCSVAECARRASKSEAWVRGRLDLLAWPIAALEAIGAGRASVASLRPLIEIVDTAERDRLIRCAVEGGATESVTRGWVASMRGELADNLDGVSARAAAASDLGAVVVTMPCYVCEDRHPAMDLRIARVCDACVQQLELVKRGGGGAETVSGAAG